MTMRWEKIFLALTLVELVSYAGYFFSILNIAGFFVIMVAALALSLRRLEYGLYFALADLILGGKSGALFSFEYGGFFLSLRMALFIVVMGVWAGKVTGNLFSRHPERSEGSRSLWYGILRRFAPQNDMLFGWSLFGLTVVWGVIVGVVRGKNFGDLFLDANGYFYGALVLPVWWVLYRRHAELAPLSGAGEESRATRESRDTSPRPSVGAQDDIVWRVFFAATTLLALKTLFAVYWFTHAGNNFIAANLVPFYQWVRDTGVGEITWLPGNFARVFFQSHIYNIMAFFGLLAFARDSSAFGLRMTKLKWYVFLALNAAVILVALSRSFWVGVVAGLIVLGVAQAFRPDVIKAKALSYIGKMGGTFIGTVVLAVLLIFAVARFPFPPPSPADFGAATRARLQAEAAATSRWNLLSPLTRAAAAHPILGSGFGATVTYISNDPRIREANPTGEYTTSALEWGWLDFWLKLGLIGLIGPIGLMAALARCLYKASPAGLAGLAGLASIHVFTPYLNHPLGIGILILLTAVVSGYRKTDTTLSLHRT